MKRKIFTLAFLVATMMLLSGCTEVNKEITPESEGFWNEFVVYPLSQVIVKTAEAVNSFGWAIVIVTIIIRLVILPLMIKQTKNTKAMQELQPEMQKIKEKYKSKDAVSQQKMQQETMALFQKHGVNPLAGCFPLLVQMPIIFGFYQAIMRTEAIKHDSFLWFNLGAPDPLFILPLLAGATTFLQQKLMMAGMTNQNPQMAMMLWLMPIMIIVFAVNLPAALSLYWVVGNIFMIIQTLIINKPGKSTSTSVNK
ncbi:YidC family membrane integrase SpoIIIJ [Bacillus sp. FJAT-42315]|uniref:YidC family membrane integrase SpoIIIJ n=1 Tax=Bacillus sp. FJAT-42315 TaxID=2014077 RepID=UPI000C23234D|nr:YidC family membrane integrase SpoIIIJ [Bacillus sp. FJAT-42315]